MEFTFRVILSCYLCDTHVILWRVSFAVDTIVNMSAMLLLQAKNVVRFFLQIKGPAVKSVAVISTLQCPLFMEYSAVTCVILMLYYGGYLVLWTRL
jgi:hypothetical protein